MSSSLQLPFGVMSLVDGFWVNAKLLRRLRTLCVTHGATACEVPYPGLRLQDPIESICTFCVQAGILNLSICHFFGDGMPNPQVAGEQEAALSSLRKAIDFASAVGATKVVGPLGISIGQPGTLEGATAFLKRAVTFAEQASITLCLEYLRPEEDKVFLAAEDDAIAVVDAVGSSCLKVHFDTFHNHCHGRNPAQALRKIGDRLGHVHISGSERMTPGTDKIDWCRVRQGLEAADYRGAVVLELFGPETRKAIPAIAAGFPRSLRCDTSVEVTCYTLERAGIIAPLSE